MGSLIGFGNWSRYYIYILISFLARFVKEDIFGVGVEGQIIVDLRIIYHPIIILLIGFTSDFILSMITWFIFSYREKKQEEMKNSLSLSENEQKLSKKGTPDQIFELKDSSTFNIPINNDDDTTLRESPNFNRESSLKYYLIHNELATEEDLVLKSSQKFILISSGLIAIKEFVSNVVFNPNDIFSYYFLNLIIIAIILRCFYKQKFYKHHILSIILVSVVSVICLVSFILIINLILINEVDENELKETIEFTLFDIFFMFLILPTIYLIISISFCTGIIFQKNLMHSQFIPSYKFLFYKGIFGICFCIIALIFSTNFPCQNAPSKPSPIEDLDQKINETKHYEPIKCRDHFQDNAYLDNFYSYFTNDYDKLPNNITGEVLILIGYFFFNFIANFSLILVNKFLSPFHVLITECFYSLIHYPFQHFISSSKEEREKGRDNTKNYNNGSEEDKKYFDFFNDWKLILTEVIALFFEFLGYLIYMEIIQLNFCGFNRDISKNIKKRAKLDAIMSKKELNDDDTDDNEDIMNDSLEMKKRKSKKSKNGI